MRSLPGCLRRLPDRGLDSSPLCKSPNGRRAYIRSTAVASRRNCAWFLFSRGRHSASIAAGDATMAHTKKNEDDGLQVICRNKRAFHEYTVHEKLECGIVLKGTEVKSLREGGANLEDAY